MIHLWGELIIGLSLESRLDLFFIFSVHITSVKTFIVLLQLVESTGSGCVGNVKLLGERSVVRSLDPIVNKI